MYGFIQLSFSFFLFVYNILLDFLNKLDEFLFTVAVSIRFLDSKISVLTCFSGLPQREFDKRESLLFSEAEHTTARRRKVDGLEAFMSFFEWVQECKDPWLTVIHTGFDRKVNTQSKTENKSEMRGQKADNVPSRAPTSHKAHHPVFLYFTIPFDTTCVTW